MELSFPTKLPIQSKREYIRCNFVFFLNLWKDGWSYGEIARAAPENGYRFTKSDFQRVFQDYITVQDKIDRMIRIENCKIINKLKNETNHN